MEKINKIKLISNKPKNYCTECQEDIASVCKWCYQDAIETGRNKEKDIKADHLAGHYIAGRKDALQIIDNWLKNYPEDVFLKITPSLLKKASDFFMTNFGFPLDRLSAHILRDALIKIKGEIENGKNKL